MKNTKTIVVALGGNAILRAGEKGTAAEQLANVRLTCQHITTMIREGYRVVITHGNGPQVGNILIQNEQAADILPPLPLDMCGAESQGLIGYMIQQTLGNELRAGDLDRPVVTLVTQVVVDSHDPAFSTPTKPIGPYFTGRRAQRLIEARGYQMREFNHGWRRVVPSPHPQGIWERELVKKLMEQGVIVIASGGGGIPVVAEGGFLRGVEAVVDKDLAGERLAMDVGADILLMLTDVEMVALDYGQPAEQFFLTLDPAAARGYLAAGQFPPGSMGPKIEAAAAFVDGGGECAIITSLDKAVAALKGKTGTMIRAGVETRFQA